MGSFKTSNILDVIKETNELVEIGCQIMRYSVLDEADALALKEIKKKVSIPIIADIHFDYKLALLAIENGTDAIRINPGNIKNKNNLIKIINAANKKNIPIRIGINTGSTNLKTPSDLVSNMIDMISFFEENNFTNLVLSIKSSDPDLFYDTNLLLAEKTRYPIHLGLTESGDVISGVLKSGIVLEKLLQKGIGNTIRISLPSKREDEITAIKALLNYTKLGNFPNLIICPTCGRAGKDIKKVQDILIPLTKMINKKINIAIMGCVVNGLLEAKDANIGVFLNNDEILLYSGGTLYKKTSIKTLEEDFLALIKTHNF